MDCFTFLKTKSYTRFASLTRHDTNAVDEHFVEFFCFPRYLEESESFQMGILFYVKNTFSCFDIGKCACNERENDPTEISYLEKICIKYNLNFVGQLVYDFVSLVRR